MSSRWAQAIGAGGGPRQQQQQQQQQEQQAQAHVQAATDEYDDESINLASLQEPKSVQHGPIQGGRARRILVPFGRSSTLKSGSLQDLKLANQANSGSGSSNQINKQQQQRPKLLRQRSSRVGPDGGSNQAMNTSGQQQQQQQPPVRAERQHLTRNPFRSSKSMLLLAQNQHIPQATAQLESFMSKQQADFINYAQYAAANAAAQSQWRNEQQQQHHPSQQAEWAHQQHALGGHYTTANELGGGGGHHQPSVLSSQHSSNQSISHHSQPMITKHHGHSQAAGGVALGNQHADHSSSNALSSEQCNEQDNEDRPNCMQIMKKLFFSLVLGTVIAICWVMIIHTLKWIAIRGCEFEASQLQLQTISGGGHFVPGNCQSGNPAAIAGVPSTYNNNNINQPPPDENIHQAGTGTAAAANLLLAHQAAVHERKQENNLQSQRRRQTARPHSNETTRANGTTSGTSGKSEPAFVSSFDDSSRRRRRKRRALHEDDADSGDDEPEQQPAPADEAGNFDKSKVMASIEQSGPLANRADATQRLAMAQKAQRQPARVESDLLGQADENDDLDSSPSDSELATSASSTLGLDQTVASMSLSPPPPLTQPFESSSQVSGNGGAVEGPQTGGQVAAARAEDANSLVYKAPFFTSWFVSIWNILFMPVFTLISSCCFRNEDSTTKKLLVESISQFMDNGLTTLQFLGRCAFFSVLWIGTIFGIVYSLTYLDATVVMALFACSAALVYLLSWVLLHQQFVGVRIVAVIICTTGIALLAYMDNSRTLGSVLIVAGSAMCSAVYKVIYQRMFGFWSIAQMSLFFTLIGLFNAFLMWPLALLLYFLGVELIVWRHIPWIHLTAAGALHLTANIVAYFGPICSYDIFLTMGLLFAVVLSAVIDVTFYKITFFGMKLAGVVLLMIGFLVCLLPENWNEYLYDLANERFIRWKKQRSMKKNRNKVQDMSTGQMSRLRTPSGRVK